MWFRCNNKLNSLSINKTKFYFCAKNLQKYKRVGQPNTILLQLIFHLQIGPKMLPAFSLCAYSFFIVIEMKFGPISHDKFVHFPYFQVLFLRGWKGMGKGEVTGKALHPDNQISGR